MSHQPSRCPDPLSDGIHLLSNWEWVTETVDGEIVAKHMQAVCMWPGCCHVEVYGQTVPLPDDRP